MTLILKVRRLDPEVPLPSSGHADDAAHDLFAAHEVTLQPGERVQVDTGIATSIPEGHVGLIWDKSGLSHNHGLKTLGGVIDVGYRGEVKVGLINLGAEPYTVERHHKVAQMIIQKKETVIIEEVDTLSDSSRGTDGFGSTGR